MAEVNVNPTRPQGNAAVSGDGATPILAKSTVDGSLQYLSVNGSGQLVISGGGGGGGGTEYVEDAASTGGEQGPLVMAIRVDSPGALVNASGDYTALQTDANGALRVTGGGGGVQYDEGNTDASITGTAILWEDTADTLRSVSAAKPLPVAQQGTVTITPSAAIPVTDNSGSLTVDGTVTANAGSGPWPVTDNGGSLTVDSPQLPTLVSGRLPVDGSGVTQPVSGTVAATQSGAWSVSAAAALPVTDNAGSLTIDSGQLPAALVSGRLDVNVGNTPAVTVSSGSVTATISGTATVDTELPAAAALADGASNPTSPIAGAAGLLYNGTTWDRVRGDTTNGIDVDVTRVQGTVTVGTHAVTQSGTWNTVDAGDVAHDSADSGNPVKVGGQARTSEITSVASGDRANLITDVQGRLVVAPYAFPDMLVQGVTSAITGTSDTSVIAAAGAGVRNYVTSLTVTNSHATVGTVVELKDGTTVIHRGYAAPAGGGYTLTFPTPLRGTANTAINAACVTTGSNVYVSASGYKSAA